MSASFVSVFRIFNALVFCTYAIIFIIISSKNSATRYFGFAELFLGIWSFFDGMQILIINTRPLMILKSTMYITAEISLFSVFLFVIHYTSGTQKSYKLSRIYLVPIIVFFVNGIIMLTSNDTLFFKFSTSEIAEKTTLIYHYEKRLAYYIHCICCYSMMVALVVKFIIEGIKHFKENKLIFLSFLIGMITFLISSLYTTIAENLKMDTYEYTEEFLTSIAMLFMASITFFILYFNNTERCINFCKNNIFDTSAHPIFIVNKDKGFLQSNTSGRDFLEKYGITIAKYEDIKNLFPENKFQIMGKNDGFQNEVYLSGIEDKNLYHVNTSEIKSLTGNFEGYYLTVTPITFYKSIMKHLENSAFKDEITGLRKNTFFMQTLTNRIHKSSEKFIILCISINSLEELNEKIGIKNANEYVRVFAQILQSNTAEHFTQLLGLSTDVPEIFRVGESVFAMLLPYTYEEKLDVFIKSIQKSCKTFSKQKNEELSFSSGYSITSNIEKDVFEFFQQSYMNMLLNRRNQKKLKT